VLLSDYPSLDTLCIVKMTAGRAESESVGKEGFTSSVPPPVAGSTAATAGPITAAEESIPLARLEQRIGRRLAQLADHRQRYRNQSEIVVARNYSNSAETVAERSRNSGSSVALD